MENRKVEDEILDGILEIQTEEETFSLVRSMDSVPWKRLWKEPKEKQKLREAGTHAEVFTLFQPDFFYNCN